MLPEDTKQESNQAARPDEAETKEPATAEPEPAVDPNVALIEQLTGECDSLKDELLRTMAEAQNIQRRLREQHRLALQYASEPLVQQILPVLDDLERALAAQKAGAPDKNLRRGFEQIERQLRKALKTANVEKLNVLGEKFDPNMHEAVTTIDSDEHEDETVAAEIQPGYKMLDRVIRPAKVQVVKKK